MHSFNQNLFSMTPYLLSCLLILLFCSPVLLFQRPTLFSSTPKVFSASPTLLSCSPKILSCSPKKLFGNPNLLFCSPILLFCSLLKISSTRRILLTKSHYQNDETQLYRHTGQLLTLAYGHRLVDKHFAGFFARKNVIEVRQIVRPHAARAHSLCRYGQA